jgi:hypothetical protein
MYSKIIFVVLFILRLGSVTAYCQNIYFDKLYDSEMWGNENEGIWGNVTKNDNGYVFFSFTNDLTTNGRSSIYWVKTNLLGDTINTTVTGIDTMSYWPTWVLPYDSGYFVTGRSYNLLTGGGLSQYLFMDFDLHGNKKAEKNYGELNRNDIPQQIIKTIDNGFAIVGQSADSISATGDMYVVKLDSLGNFEWDKYYGGTNFEAANSILQTPDSGYFVLGWTRSFGNGQRDYYLVKTDSVGNQQWHRTYGSSGMEGGWGISKLMDGNYLMAGAGETGARITKINIDGDVVWQKNYKSIASDLFYNVLPTTDDGFLLSGQCINTANNNSQDAWLLKVDSIGCAYENCTVGIDEESKKVMVDVYCLLFGLIFNSPVF